MSDVPTRVSLWQATIAKRRPFPALAEPLETDVAVVGAGITGLTTALLLRREGRSVALLEAEEIGAGTTGGSSAHVTCVPDVRLAALVDRLGVADGIRYMKSAREAMAMMQGLAKGPAGPCDWASVPAYLLAEAAADEGELTREFDAARALELPVARTDHVPLPFKVAGALVFSGQARFHPLKYLHGLARTLEDAGGRVFENTRVHAWDAQGGVVSLQTDQGPVRARRLVLATHTPLGMSPEKAQVDPHRSYVLALRVRDPLPDALFWDTAEPYHYMRRFRGEHEELLILGGADHESDVDDGSFDPYTALEEYARARFPVEGVAFCWSAPYYESKDGLPYVGPSLLAENVLVATGYSGTGLVQGTLAAQVLTSRLQSRESALRDLLEASRLAPLV